MVRLVSGLPLLALAMLCALAACIQPELVPCGNELCPLGDTCVAGTLCASPDQLAACASVADGGTCSVGGGVGRCDRGVCSATGCGNGVVDPGEACDDGNTTGGDGCSADCRKVEVCGDAVVDDGEACDDGNANPADGCDACVTTTWRAQALLGGNANATAVGVTYTTGIAVDRNGNLYLADTFSSRIRRVDATGVITIVAGTGIAGYSGDGGAAPNAQLWSPQGVAVDGLGNIYVADTGNSRIRRIDPTGVITTVAGGGPPGGLGDGGPATSAQLSFPSGVAVDGLGNLYIADTYNSRIRRVDPTGIITTVAGTSYGFAGDGGPATSAQMWSPLGVAVDGVGNVYVADTNNVRIRRVDVVTGVITTVAGNGGYGFSGDGAAATSALLWGPCGVAVDDGGNLYVADSNNQRVRRVDTATGVITTVAGTGTRAFAGDGGAATSASLADPHGVAVDHAGDVYVADSSNERIRRVDAATAIMSTVAGTGTGGFIGDGGAATSAALFFPLSVAAFGPGRVYMADTNRGRIRQIDAAGVITTIAGTATRGFSGDGGPATSAQLTSPIGIALDGLGNLYFTDTATYRVRRIDAASGVITTVAGSDLTGFSGDGGPATSARLSPAWGVAVDGVGDLYIADSGNHAIRRVDAASGIITTVAGNGIAGFGGDGGPATGAQLSSPDGIAVDGAGNVYVADTGNHRIRRLDLATGIITTIAGTGTYGFAGDGGPATAALLDTPTGIAVDGPGNVFVADRHNQRIRRIDATSGLITTFVGGVYGTDGDGGAASSASLTDAFGVALDGLGDVYIADSSGERIRRVDVVTGLIATVAGHVDPEGMGPAAQARLSDPRALVLAAPFTLFAGGSTGTVQALRSATAWLEVVTGRYPQATAIGTRARFRNQSFGTVSGVAYDAAGGLLYLSESTSNRLHVVTVVDPEDEGTWTIAPLANAAGTAGFADGAAQTARFRAPTGLYFEPATHQLYVADSGNHVIRAIDLATGVASATVHTVAGIPATRGFFGDGGAGTAALLYAPEAITRCPNGDLMIADTGNHRVRRLAAGTTTITTVLGVGVAASSGDGRPASSFPVNTPLGLACDALGNLFVSSKMTVRLVPADASGTVDGTGDVLTIYGAPPRGSFPASVTTCLTGIAVVDAATVQVTDSCTGLLVELRRGPR